MRAGPGGARALAGGGGDRSSPTIPPAVAHPPACSAPSPGPVVDVRFRGAAVRSRRGRPRRATSCARAAAGTDAVEEGARHPGGRAAPRRPSQGRGHALGGRARPAASTSSTPSSPARGRWSRERRGGGRPRPPSHAAAVPAHPRRASRCATPTWPRTSAPWPARSRMRGHADARVEAETAGEARRAVVFRVAPGPAHAGGVGVERGRRAEPRPAPAPSTSCGCAPGSPYRLRDVAADRATLALAYRNDGYLSAEVTPEVELAGGRGPRPPRRSPRPAHDRRPRGGRRPRPHAGGGRAPRAAGARGRAARRRRSARDPAPAVRPRPLRGGDHRRARGARRRSAARSSSAWTRRRAPRSSYGIGYGERDLRPRQRRGDAAQPVRHGPPAVRVRAHELPRQPLPRVLPRAVPLRPAAGAVRHRLPRRGGPRRLRLRRATASPSRRRAPSARRWSLVLRETYQEIRTFNVVEDCLGRRPAVLPRHHLRPRRPRSSATPATTRSTRAAGTSCCTDAQLSHRALGGDTLMQGLRAGVRLPAAVAARDPRPRRAASAWRGRSARSRCCCRSPSVSSPAATTACAGSASTRCARRAATACSWAPRSSASTPGGGVSVAAFTDVGNVYRAGLGHDALRPALHRRRWACATGARSARCASTGASSSTAARARARPTCT